MTSRGGAGLRCRKAPSATGRPLVFVSDAPGVWGAEHSMTAIAQELHRRGRPVHLVTSSDEAQMLWSSSVGGGVTLIPLRTRRRALRGAALLLAALRVRPLTLFLYSHHLVIWLPVLRLLPARRVGGLVFDMHDYFIQPRPALFMRAMLPFTDLVVAVSRFVLQPFEGRRFRKAVIVRPVSDATARAAVPLQFDQPVNWPRIGIVGRIDPEKRIEVVVDAVAELADARLIIRGQSDALQAGYAEEVAARAALRLGSRAELQPPRPQREALADLAVLVVGNPAEPLGRTVIEAQLCGVLAVVPDTGGSAELAGNGRYGVLYRGGDARDLARVLGEVLADPEAFRPVVEAARARALRSCTPGAYVHSLEDALRWAGVPGS